MASAISFTTPMGLVLIRCLSARMTFQPSRADSASRAASLARCSGLEWYSSPSYSMPIFSSG